jgi:hypothetical protein
VEKLDIDKRCLMNDSCLPGLYCRKNKFGIGTCRNRKRLQKMCSQDNCLEGLDCVESFSALVKTTLYKPRKCQKLPSENSPCGSQCKPGLYCGLKV